MLKHIYEKLLLLLLFLLPFQTAYIYREVFENGFKVQYATGALYATELLLMMTLIFFIVDAVVNIKRLRKRIRFRFTRDRLFVAALLITLLYGFASILWAGDKQVAFEHAVVLLEGSVLGLLILVSNTKTSTLIKAFLLGSAVSACIGIAQVIFQQTISSSLLGLSHYDIAAGGTSIVGAGTRWLRAYGTFPHPNIFGGWMAVSLVLSLHLLFSKKIKDVYAYAGIALFFSGLFLSFSRSAWIAAFTVVVFVLVREMKKYYVISRDPSTLRSSTRTRLLGMTFFRVFLLLSTLSFFFTALFHSLLTSRVMINNTYETKSVSERVEGYAYAVDYILSNSVLGSGVGNYTLAIFSHTHGYPKWDFQPVHNVFVLILAEWGIVGLALWLLCGVCWLRWMWGVTPYKEEDSLRLFAISLLVIYMLIALFDHYLYSLYPGVMVSGVIFGLATRFMLLPPE